MNDDGSGQITWSGLGDIEGVTYADPVSDFVYIARERPGNAILEFDLLQGQVTRVFDLQPWIAPADANQGIEAITFVPDGQNTEGGYFYTGVQEDGRIHVFELPIQSSTTATTVNFVETFTPNPARADLSGMDFDRLNEILFVLWDSAERFAAYRSNRSLIEDWDMYVDNSPRQEGIAVDRSGERFFSTEDDSGEIYRFTGFTIDASCSSDSDCDDLKFCTGVELCNALDECEPGTPPTCPGQHCSETLNQCVDCLTNVDCQAGEFCDAAIGACAMVPEVTSLTVERIPETRLSWADLGPGIVYDIVGDHVSTLLAQGDVSAASCLADDLPGLSWDDTGPDPAAGEADYYLVRGQHSYGVGSYGNASSGAERQSTADCP